MARSIQDLENSLSYHKPGDATVARIQTIRSAAKAFAAVICDAGGDARCQALAQTKLEESAMWSIKGLVLSEPRTEG